MTRVSNETVKGGAQGSFSLSPRTGILIRTIFEIVEVKA